MRQRGGRSFGRSGGGSSGGHGSAPRGFRGYRLGPRRTPPRFSCADACWSVTERRINRRNARMTSVFPPLANPPQLLRDAGTVDAIRAHMPRVTLSCLTLGLAGAWLTRDPAAGLAMAAGGQLALGAAGGMAGDLCKAFDRHVTERWFAKRRATDENHVVEQALRKAHLHALRKTLERFDEARRDDRDETRGAQADGFSRRLADFLDAEDTVARRLAFAKAPPNDLDAAVRTAALATLPEGYAKSLAARQAGDGQDDIRDAQRQARRLSEAAALAELRHRLLREGDDFPPLFRSAFTGEGFAQSWFDIFVLDAAATQKAGGAFAEVWQAEQVALIRSILEALSETTARIDARTERIDERTADIASDVDALKSAVAVLRKLAEDEAGKRDIAEGFIHEMATSIAAAPNLDLQAKMQAVRKAVQLYNDEIVGGRERTNLGDLVDRALAHARGLVDKGKSGLARASLRQTAEQLQRDEERRRREAADERLRYVESVTALYDRERDIALAVFDGEAAAAAIVARTEAICEPADAFAAIRKEGVQLLEHGRDRGSVVHLLAAIALWRNATSIAGEAAEVRAALIYLGIALATLGERESGTARLEAAVEAHRAALEECTRERMPLGWAMTQNNLGNALRALGERESETGRLEEAVEAYRAALEEYTRERVPLDWAMTLNNLGNALHALSTRESGTARLEEAVAAYRAALEERSRKRVPLDWATTQNNLAVSLTTLGERESGTGRLEEAVAAYRPALEEFTVADAPHYHTMASENLRRVEALLAERRKG
ncbi:tetratricopeptide repeat protein [Methylopila henanensis]|uniref:Tetratricopeptide repeat protein n=1 Tax=Methylopila henanensis TaxID=873516 RepID=A0ABW4KCK2_9HYPH